MKKLFIIAAVILLIFTVCDLDYGEIGTTGSGGGMIFFAEGNQYMECSGELGNTTWSAAVTTAKNYRGGGFDDWHLPTRNELDLMYKNLKKNDLGGFSNNKYWTAESYNDSYAYYQDFSNGNQSYADKSNSFGVRAVRSYSKEPDADSTTLKIKNESSVDIANVIWQGVSFDPSQTNNTIASGSLVTNTVQPGRGYIFFTRKTSPINARTDDLIVIEEADQKEFVFSDNTVIVDVDNPTNTGALGTLQPLLTTLRIKNESLVEITDVIWQGVSFANNQYENSIKSGTTVTRTVQPGGGYIFFKRKANPIIARTDDMVIIGKYGNIEFVFNDNTSIVEVNNPGNNGTLGALQSTVVWWDDAEGDYLPYAQRTNATYSTTSPRYGQKCIAFTSGGELRFNISLEKRARLSFWHMATNVTSNNSYQPVLNIDSVETRRWTNNNEWSFFECFIEAGNATIQFRSTSALLFLDDILIYYTE